MLACLNNKQEFEGLNSFRESLSIGMWEEAKKEISIEDLPKPFIPNHHQEYWVVSPDYVDPQRYKARYLGHFSIQNGNCFRTREDAQKWLVLME